MHCSSSRWTLQSDSVSPFSGVNVSFILCQNKLTHHFVRGSIMRLMKTQAAPILYFLLSLAAPNPVASLASSASSTQFLYFSWCQVCECVWVRVCVRACYVHECVWERERVRERERERERERHTHTHTHTHRQTDTHWLIDWLNFNYARIKI